MTHLHRILLALFCCVVAANAAEQFVVSHVTITGLKHTRQWVVEKELRFAPGDTVDNADLDAARKRLLNLELFNNVLVERDSQDGVKITVSEQWFLIPLVGFDLSEGQFSDLFVEPKVFIKKVAINAGVKDANLFGNGSSIYALSQFGAAQGFAAVFQTRWLSPKFPYAVRYGFQNLRIGDRHSSVQDIVRYQRDQQAFFQVATRSGAPSRIGLELKQENVTQIDVYKGEPKTRDRTFWFTPFAVLDRRDLEWYPSRGAMAEVQGNFAFGTKNFVRSYGSLRGYIPLTDADRAPVLALRIQGATTTSSTPKWAHWYYGFTDGFRGYLSKKTESAGFTSGDVAFRTPLTGESTYDIKLLGRYGKQWPFGIFGEVFAESVQLQLNGSRSQLYSYGTGLLFRFPYIQLLEVAYTINRAGDSSYEITTGIDF